MATKPVYEDDVESTPEIVARPTGIKPNPMIAAGEAQGKRQASGDASVAEDYAGERTKPVASKPAIVTKEQLAKSGYDNLRDYLNAQRGLTRRKEKDPTAGEARDRAAQEAADAIDPGRDMRKPRYTPPGQAPKQTTQTPKSKVFFPDRPDNSFPGSKFSKGGSVSSASRRADGIATKGKTKGTMVAMCGGGMYKK